MANNDTPETPDHAAADTGSLVLRDPSMVGNTVRASWPFSLDTMRANLAKCRLEAKEALIGAFRWCIDPNHPLTFAEFAQRVGEETPDRLRQIYSGKYTNLRTQERLDAPLELVRKIQSFLSLERNRAEEDNVEFVHTETSKRIATACEFARKRNRIGLIIGPSHCGKTFGLEHYAQANNHGRTVYVRMEAASGLGGMVRAIADGCGISEKSNTAHLVKRIKKGLTRDMLLILDELHLLAYTYRRESFFACIELLREIHDVTKCGQIQSWTRIDLLEDSRDKEMQQVWRRGVHKTTIQCATPKDIAAIAANHGLRFPSPDLEVTVKKRTDKPYEILRQLAQEDGLLAITERIVHAKTLAKKENKTCDWSHFLDAHLRIKAEFNPSNPWAQKSEVIT